MARSEVVQVEPDFVFALTSTETQSLRRSRSQSVILKRGQNVKYPPLAFSEHGAIMAATVRNSPRAVQMSIFVVRAFLRLREWVAGQAELSERLAKLEQRVGTHDTLEITHRDFKLGWPATGHARCVHGTRSRHALVGAHRSPDRLPSRFMRPACRP